MYKNNLLLKIRLLISNNTCILVVTFRNGFLQSINMVNWYSPSKLFGLALPLIHTLCIHIHIYHKYFNNKNKIFKWLTCSILK